MQVNYNYKARRHTDSNNIGPSFIQSIGTHDGGKLWTADAFISVRCSMLNCVATRRAKRSSPYESTVGGPNRYAACAGELRSAMYGRATVCPPSSEQSPSTEARTPTHPTALPERVLQAAEVSMQSMPLSSAVSKGSREVSRASHRSRHGIRQHRSVTAML